MSTSLQQGTRIHPRFLELGSLLLIAPLCVVGAIIGVQLIVTLGITANTSLIGALAGAGANPAASVHPLPFDPRAEPGAERNLGRHIRRR